MHGFVAQAEHAKTLLLASFTVSKWLVEIYGENSPANLESITFIEPPKNPTQVEIKQLEKELAAKVAEIDKISSQLKVLPADQHKALQLKAFKAADKFNLTESETRAIIDDQLQQAGWEADTNSLKYSKGTRPQRVRNIAIAEWPISGKYADYALFIGTTLYGIVEAKKRSKNTISDLGQAKVYSKLLKDNNEFQLLGKWREYHTPFLFSTNSRPYHNQLPTQSGTWFLDVRLPHNYPRALRGWFSPQDLVDLFEMC